MYWRIYTLIMVSTVTSPSLFLSNRFLAIFITSEMKYVFRAIAMLSRCIQLFQLEIKFGIKSICTHLPDHDA
jgi:hypothetical protein